MDEQPQTTTPEPPNPALQIGSMAIKNSDEKFIEPGEQLVTVVHRHAIGIVGIYIEMLGGIATIIIVAALVVAGIFGTTSKTVNGLVAAGAVLVIGFIVALLIISLYVYRQSKIIVTDQSLVSVVQKALFGRKIARLSMSDVEDVTAEQGGLLPTMFNYGTLTIQTAGEEDNFVFPLCPNPNNFADQILEARQAYVREHA